MNPAPDPRSAPRPIRPTPDPPPLGRHSPPAGPFPQTSATRQAVRASPREPGRRGPLPGTDDLYAQDPYARTLLASLMRAQLGVTVSVLAPAGVVVALYPLLSVLFPAVAHAEVGPLPLSLVVLGGGLYPPLVLLGFWYVRRARRVEQRFIDLFKEGAAP